MMIASDEVTPGAILEAVRDILGELELQASEDAALPGFAISFDVHSKPICLYLRVLGTDGIRVSARLPVNFVSEDKAMASLVLANEITRRIHFGSVYFQPEERQMEVRISMLLMGLPDRIHTRNILHRVLDLTSTVYPAVQTLCEGENGFQEALSAWEKALEAIKVGIKQDQVGVPTGKVLLPELNVLRN